MATQQRRSVQTAVIDHRSTDDIRVQRSEWSRLGRGRVGEDRPGAGPQLADEPRRAQRSAADRPRNGEVRGCARPASTNRT